MCIRPWTCGLPKWSRPTVAARPCCAATPMTGGAPAAIRTTQNASSACSQRGERSATSRWHQRSPASCGAAACTLACNGALPFWDSSASGRQIDRGCRASNGGQHARSSRLPASGSRQGASSPGTCRGVNATGGGPPGYRATTSTTAYKVTLARFSAFVRGPCAVCANGAIDEVGSGSVLPGSSARRASIESR